MSFTCDICGDYYPDAEIIDRVDHFGSEVLPEEELGRACDTCWERINGAFCTRCSRTVGNHSQEEIYTCADAGARFVEGMSRN